MKNRVQYEIDLMNKWLKERGTAPYPARVLIDDFEDSDLLQYLGFEPHPFRKPSVRQVLNALTRKMESWNGRYVDDEYVWEFLGIQPFGKEGALKLFRCVKG